MAGRPIGPTGVRLTEEHRAKIQKSNVLNRLIRHAEGKEAMQPSEVTAGLGLLKKALPDLSAVTLNGQVDHTHREIVEERANKFTEAMQSLIERSESKARPN